MSRTEVPPRPRVGHQRWRSATIKSTRDSFLSVHTSVLLIWILSGFFARPAQASELKPATSAAFDRYIAATEAQRESDAGLAQFLIIDPLPDAQRQAAYDQLQQGQVYIQELRTREEDQSIPIPSGLVHHWAGVIFIPKATLPEVLAVLNDYDHQADIYKPDVRQSKLLGQTGDDAEIFEQFYSKTIVTVVLNAYFHVAQRPLSASRCESASRSTRIVEVMNPDSPEESEGEYGKDHGYMWRLNSYWRIEEKDGGVYVQNESVSLSRTMPVLLAWLIEPLTKSIPRDVLSRTLEDTRRAVEANAAKANTGSRKQEPRPADATP